MPEEAACGKQVPCDTPPGLNIPASATHHCLGKRKKQLSVCSVSACHPVAGKEPFGYSLCTLFGDRFHS